MISLIWQDVEGNRIPSQLYFDSTDVATVALAATQLTKYEPLLEAMSGCAIVEASVTFPLTADTNENPDGGYSVRAGAYLSFRDSDGVGQGIYLPGILGDKISNDAVDDSDSDVSAFVDAATGNGTDGEEPLSTRGSASIWSTWRGGRGASRKV